MTAAFKNALLIAAATAFGIFLVEAFAFPVLLSTMSANMAGLTQDFARQLAQSSKAGIVPRDYVMLTGDSYAEGLGDALRERGGSGRRPYASAHLIAERLGRDVITVGRGGAGNARAAAYPIIFEQERRMSWRYAVPPPATIVFYFYEGNDLTDNLRWANLGHDANAGQRAIQLDEVRALLARDLEANERFLTRLSRWGQVNLPGLHFMFRGFDLEVVTPLLDWLAGHPPDRRPAPAERVTRARIGGAEVALPNRLQGPALDVSPVEWSNAVLILAASLDTLKKSGNGVPLVVAYIPSPLASYDIVSDAVSYQTAAATGPGGGANVGLAPATEVAARHVRMRGDVCAVARDLGLPFVDASQAIRAVARERQLHGPGDWTHFNLDGYRILADVVAGFLAGDERRPADCPPRTP